MVDASEEEATMEIQSGLEEGRVAKEASRTDKLEPRIIDNEPQTASIRN